MSALFNDSDYVAVHENPIWRDKADFIIRAYIGENEWEQLWAKNLGDMRFYICCIPFFIHEIALGDEVETDENYLILKVVKSSGNFTFRIWFGESVYPESQIEVLNELNELGVQVERSSANLFAINASDYKQAQKLANYLQTKQDMGYLIYETGKLA